MCVHYAFYFRISQFTFLFSKLHEWSYRSLYLNQFKIHILETEKYLIIFIKQN